jgi:hypothetical protein
VISKICLIFRPCKAFLFIENANMAHEIEAFSNMAAAHNMFIQGLNAIIYHGPLVTEDKVEPFMLFCITLVSRASYFLNLLILNFYPFFSWIPFTTTTRLKKPSIFLQWRKNLVKVLSAGTSNNTRSSFPAWKR